MSLDIAKLLNR